MKNRFSITLLLSTVLLLNVYNTVQSQSRTDTVKKPDNTIIEREITQLRDLPLIFRRTTLIVRDINKSLSLYRDIIGMEVIYDNTFKLPHAKENRDQLLRLVFLKATHRFNGVLGLLEYDADIPNKVHKPIRKEGFSEQNIVLLFNSKNQESQFKKIKKLPGIEVISEPKIREYPSYDGKGTTRVMVSIFYDLDGFLVEFNKLLDDI